MIKTSQFEAVKLALKQDKNGYVLTLLIHPDDISEDVMRDFVGARYQLVMVRLNDDETPMAERPKERKPLPPPSQLLPPKDRRDETVMSAGMLCRSPRFWDWLDELGELQNEHGLTVSKCEDNAVLVLHRIIGVNSRKELADPKFKPAYEKLLREFSEWESKDDNVPF